MEEKNKKRKNWKLPNGYGSIVKLPGKRRKPFAIRITIGWTDEGKQIRKYIDYAETRAKALKILADYHNEPYNIDFKNITFEALYNLWLPIKSKKVAKKSLKRYINALKYYKGVKKKRFVDIKLYELQKIIDECPHGYSTKSDIKGLYTQLYEYAKDLEVPVTKNYAEKLDIGTKEDSDLHSDFTEKEIEILWNNLHIDFIGSILIMIYTGLRPTELLTIKEIHLEKRYMIGGIKTEAGIDRIIPINEKIVPLIEEYLLTDKLKIHYNTYSDKFKECLKKLGLDFHKPGDGRHTFATLMDRAGANKLCIKLIMGHSTSKDVTDNVYIHKNLDDLLKAVNMI